MRDQKIRISKFLSLVLRHEPEKVGLTLDEGGWVSVGELLQAFAANDLTLTLAELQEIVRSSDKQRFAFSPDGLRIRASQGHSVKVQLGYEQVTPPVFLYHGTAERFLPSIREQGLVKGQRHDVHLSENGQTATTVGSRHGRPVVLKIASGQMSKDGHLFFRSANGVWLTDSVPLEYIEFPNEQKPGN